MSIYYSGTFKRSAGIVSAIAKQIKLLNLKAVQRINIKFDPFGDDAKQTREFLFYLSTPKVSLTNPKCALKTDVICGRQPGEILFTLNEPAQKQSQLKKIKLVSENLSTLELLQLCNKHISALAPEEDTSSAIQTKSSKKQSSVNKRIIKKK